jgi:hypothetical protein
MAEFKYAYTIDQSNPAGGDFVNESGLFNGWLKMTSKLQGGTITNTAGVEVKNFAGWTSSVTLGLKSDLVIGSYILPASYKFTLGGDCSMQRGQKKDKSWGDKNEWRKGGITLRLNGEKTDFVTKNDEQFQLGEKIINSNKKTRLVNLLSQDFFVKKEYTKTAEVNAIIKQQEEIVSVSTRTVQHDNAYATQTMKMLGRDMSIAAVNEIIQQANILKVNALKVDLKGTINLGGIAIPNAALAAKLAAAEAKRNIAIGKMNAMLAAAEAKLGAIQAAEAAKEATAQANALRNEAAAIGRAVI